MIKIAPSLISSDFSNLHSELKKLKDAGADLVHIDIMDGHFVPNITIGPDIVSCLRNKSSLPFDVHLMIENPDLYIERFIDAGADIISIHVEACTHIHRTIQNIKKYNVKTGVALNPSTSLDTIKWLLSEIDIVLIMTVNPGFSGQSYISNMTNKIKELKNMIDSNNLNVDIEVDGGINFQNVNSVISAGANIIVSGATVFGNVPLAIRRLKGTL